MEIKQRSKIEKAIISVESGIMSVKLEKNVCKKICIKK